MANNDGFNLNDMLGTLFGFPMPTRQQAEGRDSSQQDSTNGADGGFGAGGSGNGAGGSGNDTDDEPHANIDISGAFNKMAEWSKRALIVLGIILVLVLVFCYWWFHPAINLHSTGVWWWLVLISLIVAASVFIWSLRHHKDEATKELRKKWRQRALLVPIIVIAIFALGKVAGFSIIPGNAHRYASVLDTQEGTFAQDIDQVNYDEVPVIDHDSAVLLGNRAMGSIPEYVSQFEISDMYSQINYHGKPVRVSPLNYADLFKWLTNRTPGIPAYVIVDMTTQEAQVVRLEQPIKYSESEPLARNIDRYVQLKFPTYMFDEKSFEIDEDGVPWWVFPVQKRTIGLFDGTDIQRVVLVNASTGECQDYAIEDCPEWVDRAYPSDLLITQYNWSGLYSGGWFNSWIGQRNVVRTTPGTDGTLGYNYIAQNDDVYLYSGVSSVTADNSIIGFILINQRTGDSRFYSVAGATEDSAMVSAEGAVQNLRYTATFPLLLNIENQPTYFMALKDSAGLVKKFAMVNIEQYQNVAVGDTVAQTQTNYIALLAQQGVLTAEEVSSVSLATSIAGPQVTGIIDRMSQAVIDGNSHFYVTLEDGAQVTLSDTSQDDSNSGEDSDSESDIQITSADGVIFDFALPDLVDIVTYQPGDEITFTFTQPSEGASTTTVSATHVGAIESTEDALAAAAVSAGSSATVDNASADESSDADNAA